MNSRRQTLKSQLPPELMAIILLLAGWTLLFGGCASSGGASYNGVPVTREVQQRPGTRVAALELVRVHENVASAYYYPVERMAGCTYSSEGTLIFCDEGRGKVFGLEPGALSWHEFDSPMARPYRPVDVKVDGFKVLVLDGGGDSIYRFDLAGRWQDQMLDVARLDPGVTTRGIAFDVDRDGRMIIADENQQEVLLLDAFLALNMRLGGPGRMDDQFGSLGGVTFLPDGSILASDADNRRLAWYGRLGFFESVVGGEFDAHNPFAAPAGLDHDRYGNIFVADPGNSLIHILDPGFQLVFSSGQEFDLRGIPIAPVDVAVGPNDLLAVTDQARAAILVYRIIYE